MPNARTLLTATLLLLATMHLSSARATQFSIIGAITGAAQIGAIKGNTLYGTVAYPEGGVGTLFSMTVTGSYTLLHNFNGDTDGAAPNGRLAIDASGNIFGTAANGGANGAGTLWKFSPAGVMSTPHAFGAGSDGAHPFEGPSLGPNNSIVDTTSQGAVNGNGNIFSISSRGVYAVVYEFQSRMDGHCPFSGVAVSRSGAIYGTTVGIDTGGNPTGSIYKYTKAGGLQTLYVFQDGSDGEWPDQAPVLDSAGNVYGTTHMQNGSPFAGAIWKISATGKFTLLYNLNGATDGFGPNGPLLLNTDGYLYGTTASGGAYGYGTVFRISTTGQFTLLHSFTSGADGAQPTGNLIRSSTGTVYGGTDWGTIFKIVP